MFSANLTRLTFLLNGFILLILGGIYLFVPSIVLLDGKHTNESFSLLRLVSISLILLGTIALIFYKNFKENDNLHRMVSLTFIVLHLLFGFHWFGYTQLGNSATFYNIIPHLVLGIVGLIAYFK